jgi:O-glycosyl hydrolase
VKPTQYLLDHQNEPDFISTKVELGTWRPQDVYKINWEDVDPLAIAKNLTCEIEKMMGISPNVPILQDVS